MGGDANDGGAEESASGSSVMLTAVNDGLDGRQTLTLLAEDSSSSDGITEQIPSGGDFGQPPGQNGNPPDGFPETTEGETENTQGGDTSSDWNGGTGTQNQLPFSNSSAQNGTGMNMYVYLLVSVVILGGGLIFAKKFSW